MTSAHINMFQNRRHAAVLLVEKLIMYKDSNALIVAIPPGGVPVGYQIAQALHLPMEAMPCKRIEHPGHRGTTIGSISSDDVVMHDENQGIPQDYIYHQIMILQRSLKEEDEHCQGPFPHANLKGRTVILADDLLKTGDTMLACARSIRRQEPARIIGAVPVVTPEGLVSLSKVIDEIVYLVKEPASDQIIRCYSDFPSVSETEVCLLIDKAREELNSARIVSGNQ